MKNNKNIFLCGFMGCGKTTNGIILAKKMDYKFLDLDDYIEKKQNLSIEQIFKIKGEEYFRYIENKYLYEICKKNIKKTVIATGGGTIISSLNANIINSSGISIFLNLPFKSCYKNIINDKKNRPLNKSFSDLQLLYKKTPCI